MSLSHKVSSLALRQAARSLFRCNQLRHNQQKYFCRTLTTTDNKFYSPVHIRCAAPVYIPSRSCSTKAESTEAKAEEGVKEEVKGVSEEQKKIDSLSEELKLLTDKYHRTLADRENIRLRLQKQVEDSKIYAIQGFCKDLLEVSDVFRKAIESVSEEDASSSPQLKTLYDGLTMTEAQFHSIFKKNGLLKLSTAVGDKFDPKWHESMFQVPASQEHAPGTVAHVMRDGWSLRERCIRSAQVGVYTG